MVEVEVGGGGVGGAYPFFSCLRHLIMDHASLLRWSVVPTPYELSSPKFGRSVRFFHPYIHVKNFTVRFFRPYIHVKTFSLILSSSSLAVCAHLSIF